MTGPDPLPPRWRAAGPVDPGWTAPGAGATATSIPQAPADAASDPIDDPAPGTGRRRPPLWVLIGAPLVALAVLVGVTIALGGFGQRKDQRHDVAVGTEITTGPYVMTITRATAQSRESLGKPSYQVIVYGTIRNTSDNGSVPTSSQFYGKDLTDPEIEQSELVSIGDNTDATVGNTVTPGLPPVTLRLQFEFGATWKPSGTFRIAIADLTEVARTFGGKDPHLEPDADSVYRVNLPMEVLAPQKS